MNGEGRFSPRFTFSLGWYANAQSTTQTVSTQINAMKFIVKSGNDTVFADGTKITAKTSSVKSKHLKFGPAMQVQRSSNSNAGFDLSIDESGLGAGVHGGAGSGKSVHYQNAVFDVENQTWQAEDMNGQGVTLRGRIGHFDIKNMNLESVQSTDKSTNAGGSFSASQSGAFSGSFNYHNVDNAWINERSCLEFEELHGHIEHLKQIASDIKAGVKSTMVIDKAEGQDLQDHLDEHGINIAAGVSKGNAVPVTADLDYLRKHTGGKQKSSVSESINVAHAENLVRNEKDKYVADEEVDTHIHLVAAWIDTQQVKQAFSDLQDLFKKEHVSVQEFSEKFDALKKEGASRSILMPIELKNKRLKRKNSQINHLSRINKQNRLSRNKKLRIKISLVISSQKKPQLSPVHPKRVRLQYNLATTNIKQAMVRLLNMISVNMQEALLIMLR